MDNRQEFLQYITEKGKKQNYIDSCKELLDDFFTKLGGEPASSGAIDAFVRGRWCGYVSKDRATYKILNDYADFCEKQDPLFTRAFYEHIRLTFEGEARKAMSAYKNTLVFIPKDTKIDSFFLNGMSNAQFIETFTLLQQLIYAIYDAIERGSPFDWGWPDWKAITADGLNQNRVIQTFEALTNSSDLDGDTLVVNKKHFSGYEICKPIAKTKLMLKGLTDMGFHIEWLDDKKSPSFTVSFPALQNLIAVLHAYFKSRRSYCSRCGEKCTGDTCWRYFCINHIRVFSYRFVEDSAAQNRERFFLAKTDGEPEFLREIYYWLYDEAIKHEFTPMGYEHMGCYLYKKGNKDWLLLGSGHSYHEEEFLHSPNYKMAAKSAFYNIRRAYPEKLNEFIERFPDTFGRKWFGCWQCKANHDECKNRLSFTLNNRKRLFCAKTCLYFHDPTFDDVKAIYELYKLENNIKGDAAL